MTLSLDHSAQELLSRGYIRRLEKEELYDFTLKAQEELVDFFAVLGGQPVFDTEVQMIGLRRMGADAIQSRAEGMKADAASGLFRGHALSFSRAVVLWFFRKQLDADLENGSERSWLTLDEIMRGVAAYYPAGSKDDEAKFTRALTRTLTFLTNNNLAEDHNSPRGQVWSAHPALRVALGADEMEAFTQQIIDVLEQAKSKDSQADDDAEDLEDEDALSPTDPDHPDSLWSGHHSTGYSIDDEDE